MHADRNVIAFTPYGREVTVSILLAYLRREHEIGVLDEWWLCMNTDDYQHEDVAYAHRLAAEYDWIKVVERPSDHPDAGQWHRHKQMYTRLFYYRMTDRNTIYLRFDDDIVYVHDQAIRKLVERKVSAKSVLSMFPIIWNNAICSYYLQQMNKIPREYGVVGSAYCMDPVGWADAYFAENIHELFLSKIKDGTVEDLMMHHDIQLAPGQQFSVSCFAVDGNDYADLNPPGVLDCHEEEHWHTVHRPQLIGKTNVICAEALVSHFSFYGQRDYLINQTDILDRYRKLSESL